MDTSDSPPLCSDRSYRSPERSRFHVRLTGGGGGEGGGRETRMGSEGIGQCVWRSLACLAGAGVLTETFPEDSVPWGRDSQCCADLRSRSRRRAQSGRGVIRADSSKGCGFIPIPGTPNTHLGANLPSPGLQAGPLLIKARFPSWTTPPMSLKTPPADC